MRRLILIAAMSALVLAKPKPETYKETEDFQYSRSSSDDGTKSGFYGAQRGNMGGNYERAHNMDTLAQHQMSGLVKQVDGELGDGAKTRTGSVYTAANSRGIYGSGNYDLGNLQGRNFAEGETFGNSQSHSSLSSQNSGYGSKLYSGTASSAGISSSHSQDARYSGYQTSRHTDQRQTDNLQAVATSQDLGRYDANNQAGHNMKYHTQFGSHGRSDFDQSSANLHSSSGYDANSQAHYITTPVRVVLRPGGRVAIPIAAPTYAVSQLSENNGLNKDAEVLNQQVESAPTNKVKHYEASYSYRKQWEKHHAVPGDGSIVVPTENPFPKNSELYEDAQLLQSSKNLLQNGNSQTSHSGNTNSDQRAYSKSASSQSRFQAGYNSQQSQSGFDSQQNQGGFESQSQSGLSSQYSHSDLNSQQSHLGFNAQQSHLGFNSQHVDSSSGTSANTYGRNAQTQTQMAADLTNTAGDVNSKPKGYHSSYSYHKSWERQGDPYVIKPVGGMYGGQASERLTAGSSNSAAYSSHQFGSHSRQAHQTYSADCDDQAHVRVARSYTPNQQLEQSQNQWEDLGQQTQSKLENLEDLGQQQQNKWDDLQDLGQQTQNQWDNLQQLGQETQNQWDNLQQLGQQTQNQWDNLQQLGQQTQDKWDNLEDLGQQTHSDLEQHQNENLEDFSQVSQNEDALTNFEQQANNHNDNLDVLSQHAPKENPLTNFEQQTNNQNGNLENIFQHPQKEDALTTFEQQASNQNTNLDILSQHSHTEDSLTNFEQQTNSQNVMLSNSNNWDQTTDFELQPNADIVNQQFHSISKQNNSNRNLFDQNQENIWYQSNANINKNIDSYDFMKPISQWTANEDNKSQHHEVENKVTTVNDNQNLFALPSSNTEYNKFWSESKDQNVFWNTQYNQNTDNKYEHNFWHMNHFNQIENSSPPTSFSNSDTGHPLQSLWDKIDSIAGEITPNEGNVYDKKPFSSDYPNFYSQNQNVSHMQTENDWSYLPVNQNNVDFVNTSADTESKEINVGHNNLFDEETQNITIFPILPRPMENDNLSINTNQHPSNSNQNIHSQDEGRGDIGPEETPLVIGAIDKPYKTAQEIETLSLTNEAVIPKESDVITQATSIKNKHENNANEILVTNLNKKENTDDNKHELLTTERSTTMLTEEINTTVKNNNNVHNKEPSNKPILDVLDLNINSLPDLQKQIFPQQSVENVEIPIELQQQNLEQQFEDFSQLQNFGFPANNLQQGDDQQNMDQQFEAFNPQEGIQGQNSEDFGQQIQSSSSSLGDLQKKEEEQKFQPSTDSKNKIANPPQIMEPIHVTDTIDLNSKYPNLELNEKVESSKLGNIQSPVETIAESTGFWKSVGNKLKKAKNKVFSWFSSS